MTEKTYLKKKYINFVKETTTSNIHVRKEQ